jgi:hypothetical protein
MSNVFDKNVSFSSDDEGVDYVQQAKDAVITYNNGVVVDDSGLRWLAQDEVYVAWFSKTLKNWKALVSTTKPDGRYYEVTYNGEKEEIYLVVYVEQDNIILPKSAPVDVLGSVRDFAKQLRPEGA